MRFTLYVVWRLLHDVDIFTLWDLHYTLCDGYYMMQIYLHYEIYTIRCVTVTTWCRYIYTMRFTLYVVWRLLHDADIFTLWDLHYTLCDGYSIMQIYWHYEIYTIRCVTVTTWCRYIYNMRFTLYVVLLTLASRHNSCEPILFFSRNKTRVLVYQITTIWYNYLVLMNLPSYLWQPVPVHIRVRCAMPRPMPAPMDLRM